MARGDDGESESGRCRAGEVEQLLDDGVQAEALAQQSIVGVSSPQATRMVGPSGGALVPARPARTRNAADGPSSRDVAAMAVSVRPKARISAARTGRAPCRSMRAARAGARKLAVAP